MASESDDEPPALSGNAAAALSQFLTERRAAEEAATADPFAENWGMSQFWYTEDTAALVAEECVRCAGGGAVACVACPSLFRRLRQHHPAQPAHLFEFDTRFEVLGDFSFYDYNEPFSIEERLHHAFSVVVIDPPYLARECLEKSLQSARLLAREQGGTLLALTGASMREVAQEQAGLRPVAWRPEHKNKLGNEFCLYAASDATAARFGGWDSYSPAT